MATRVDPFSVLNEHINPRTTSMASLPRDLRVDGSSSLRIERSSTRVYSVRSEFELPEAHIVGRWCARTLLFTRDAKMSIDFQQQLMCTNSMSLRITRAVELPEPGHRSGSAFDGPMDLLHDVVRILDLTNRNAHLALGIHRRFHQPANSCRPGACACETSFRAAAHV
jgi:hypothetical protein